MPNASPSATARMLSWIGPVSQSLAALSIVTAACFFIFDRLAPITLEVDSPLVIEFRCSTLSFNAKLCFDGERADTTHLSMSAALRFSADGPAVQHVTVMSARATIQYEARENPIILTAFWSGDLTGGQGNFQQVLAQSIAGGQTISKELWFMPLSRFPSCPPKGDIFCKPERDNFHPWHLFVGDIANMFDDATAKRPVPEIDVRIDVTWRVNEDEPSVKELPCQVELGETAKSQLSGFEDEEKPKPLYMTLTCRPMHHARS